MSFLTFTHFIQVIGLKIQTCCKFFCWSYLSKLRGRAILFGVKVHLLKTRMVDFTTYKTESKHLILQILYIQIFCWRICIIMKEHIWGNMLNYQNQKWFWHLSYDMCQKHFLAAILFHSNTEINGGLLSIFGKYWPDIQHYTAFFRIKKVANKWKIRF